MAYTFSNGILDQTNYLKDANNDQVYPQDPATNAEIAIGNAYAKDSDDNERYPKDKDGNEFIVGGRYARDKDGNESYPKDKDGNEASTLTTYTKDADGNEQYPKAKLKAVNLAPYPLGTTYAKDKDGKYAYPQTHRFKVLLYADDTPAFIPNDGTVACKHLEEAVAFGGKKYVFADPKRVGALYLSVMQSASDTVYKKWKTAESSLPSQYKKHSKKFRSNTDVYVRDGDQYFVLDADNEEVAVVFDKKFRMHRKAKNYYVHGMYNDLYYDKLYRRRYFVLSKDKKTRHYVLSYLDRVFYKRKSSSEIESYTLDVDENEVAGTTFKIGEFYQSMNSNNVLFFHAGAKSNYVFDAQKKEFILVDFAKKKQSYHMYYMKGSNKQYFEWDAAGKKKDVNAPSDALNEESDAETDISVKTVDKDIEPGWSIVFCVYVALLIIAIFSGLVFIYYRYIA